MRFSAWGPRLFAGLVLSLLIAGVGHAQERTGEISGVVVDESGAPVPGATIRAESKTLPRPLETVSDASGRYQMLNVPIGQYTLTVSLAGFNTLKQAMEVKISSQITFNPKLTVGQMTETIEVKAGMMSIDPTSSRTATNITRQQIEDLRQMFPANVQHQPDATLRFDRGFQEQCEIVEFGPLPRIRQRCLIGD